MELITQENWLQAQYSVLGAVLIDGNTAPKVVQQMRETDFFAAGRTVYKAILKLFQEGQPIDPVTVVHTLGPNYRDLIKQLMEITPSAANLDTYMKLCREQAQLVTVREIAGKLSAVEDNESARKLLEEAAAIMVDKTSVKIYTMADCIKSFYERHTGDVKYLNWPIPVLNDVLYTEPGDFVIIGGRPSAGKSAFALQCAKHWSKTMKVGFFSLETGQGKLFDRYVSGDIAIRMDDLKKNRISQRHWEDMAAAVPQIGAKALEVVPAADMTVADIRSTTIMKGYEIIIIDYIQLIPGRGANRTEEVTGISMALHRMAQSLGVTVVGLSQLRRIDEKQKNRNLDLSDLRESGQLEQDADAVLLLKLEKEDDYGGNRVLFIAKNKEGETPKTFLAFDGKHQTFSAISASKKEAEANEINRNMKKGDSYAVASEKAQKSVQGMFTEAPEQLTMLPAGTSVPFEE